jgi:colicin import membrane protein
MSDLIGLVKRLFLVVMPVLLAQGCSISPILPDSTLLPQFTAATVINDAQASNALQQTQLQTEWISFDARQRDIQCYERFFVNTCLNEVLRDRKAKENRIRQIELLAQSVLRASRANEKSQEIAQSIRGREQIELDQTAAREAASRDNVERQKNLELRLEKARVIEDQAPSRTAASEAALVAKLKAIEAKESKAQLMQQREAKERARFASKAAAKKEKTEKAKP